MFPAKITILTIRIYLKTVKLLKYYCESETKLLFNDTVEIMLTVCYYNELLKMYLIVLFDTNIAGRARNWKPEQICRCILFYISRSYDLILTPALTSVYTSSLETSTFEEL